MKNFLRIKLKTTKKGVAQCSGYTELLKSISPAMTYINQHKTAAERNDQSL